MKKKKASWSSGCVKFLTMLSELLNILDEKKDADKLDDLLDINEDLFFNLILYFYKPKPSIKQQSISVTTSISPSPSQQQQQQIHNEEIINKNEYTLSEKSLIIIMI